MSTTAQQAIAIIPMFTGTISLIGSIAIMVMILRSYLRLTTCYHRILFGLSFCDIFQSIGLAVSSLPVPKGTEGILYAIGNQWTCNIQGFVYLFGATSVPLYFCGLTGYFLLAIKVGMSEENMKKYYEPIVHLVALLHGIISPIFVAAHSGFFTSGER